MSDEFDAPVGFFSATRCSRLPLFSSVYHSGVSLPPPPRSFPAMSVSLLWFRQDLRLEDNSALAAALARGRPVLPVYIWSPDDDGRWARGGASRWWLHHALESLRRQLAARGLPLILRSGPAARTLLHLAREAGADVIYCNRRFEPVGRDQETLLEGRAVSSSIKVSFHHSTLLFEPETVMSQAGTPFKVFTPFYRNLQARGFPEEVKVAWPSLPPLPKVPDSEALADWKLLPAIAWDQGFYDFWHPDDPWGRLTEFGVAGMKAYSEHRDLPAEDGTSRLAPFLHFGQIGPRQIVSFARRLGAESSGAPFLRQIVWREFGAHLLFHFPHTDTEPLSEKFKNFPWKRDETLLKAWREGKTGYPIVDAGMRQLWQTGWMHNRVRMIVGSLLVKHLLQPWQAGADWFWDTLVDADLANNSLGWQWIGGCGADAAPYFRIFNPVSQGEKFDPDGSYVRRYVPELAKLPSSLIHRPWEADLFTLRQTGIVLGETYPAPIVGLTEGRDRALKAWADLKALGVD